MEMDAMRELQAAIKRRRKMQNEVVLLSEEKRDALFDATYAALNALDHDTALHDACLDIASACAAYRLDREKG